jgi:exosome complex RNA-binding protein Rrp42 (RNase PH superfamily)
MNISNSELQFIKHLNSNFLRIDSRKFLESRKIKIEKDIFNNCFSSISITFLSPFSNSNETIILTLKGEVVKKEEFEVRLSFEPKPKEDVESKEVMSLIESHIIRKINHEIIFPSSITTHSWRFYIDIFSTSPLKFSLFQMISKGIKLLFEYANIPKIMFTQNLFDNTIDYFVEGSEDRKTSSLSYNDQVYSLLYKNIDDLYVFGMDNDYNNLYFDPSDAEIFVLDTFFIVNVSENKRITGFYAIKGNVDMKKINEVERFIKEL